MITQDGKAIDCGDRDRSIGGYILDRNAIKEQVRQLSKINNSYAAWAIARQWLIIIAAALIVVTTFYLLTGHFALIPGLVQLNLSQLIILLSVYLLAGFIIATRQHALAVIMHDAAHFRLFTHRATNDIISDIFCAFPNGLATSLYRRRHLEHHRFINSDKDPDWLDQMAEADWRWPKSKADAIVVFLGDIFGWNIPRWGKVIAKWSPWPILVNFTNQKSLLTTRERWLFIAFWSSIALGLTLTQTWLYFILIWVVPQLTILNLLARIRAISEHLGLPNEDELSQSRHIKGTWLERMSICPLNINIHLAHHMFPAVPHYNLLKLHHLLMSDRVYRTKTKIYPNYLSLKNGVFADLVF